MALPCIKPEQFAGKAFTKDQQALVTMKKEYIPQLWSHHQLLKETPAQCAVKGESILKSLGFKSIVKNGHYIYANFSNNRAVLKCVALINQTFVYVAVAGADVKLVEKLRSEIAWKL